MLRFDKLLFSNDKIGFLKNENYASKHGKGGCSYFEPSVQLFQAVEWTGVGDIDLMKKGLRPFWVIPFLSILGKLLETLT